MIHWFLKGEENYENHVVVQKSALHGAIIDSLSRSRVEPESECHFQLKMIGVSACRL
jgi:hypothetical protein